MFRYWSEFLISLDYFPEQETVADPCRPTTCLNSPFPYIINLALFRAVRLFSTRELLIRLGKNVGGLSVRKRWMLTLKM